MIGLLSFMMAILEFICLGFTLIWMLISGVFYYLPRWCYRSLLQSINKKDISYES